MCDICLYTAAYLGVICLLNAEKSFQRVVTRNNETSSVDQKFASKIEKNQEEVECAQSENDIDFGNGRLLLEVVQDWIP